MKKLSTEKEIREFMAEDKFNREALGYLAPIGVFETINGIGLELDMMKDEKGKLLPITVSEIKIHNSKGWETRYIFSTFTSEDPYGDKETKVTLVREVTNMTSNCVGVSIDYDDTIHYNGNSEAKLTEVLFKIVEELNNKF